MTTALFRSLLGIAGLCAQSAIVCDILTLDGEAAITRGRSNMAATFLGTDYQTLAMLDADISIDPQDFMKLLHLERPIRGAAVCLKTRDHSEALNVYAGGRRVVRADMPAEPFEVELMGGAVMLVERQVIEKLSQDESLQYDDPINGKGCHIFAERIEDGALLTEDFAFTFRAREAGFTVWCHPEVVVGHIGPCMWSA